MGFKRPFDDEKFHELPLKHSRQLGYGDKSTQFEEFVPRQAVSQKSLSTVNEEDVVDGKSPDGETFDEESSFVYTGLNMDGAFDRVMEGCDGKDAAQSPTYLERCMPPRVFASLESYYTFLLDQPPRKQVPIGPAHQAIIPEWEGSQNENQELSGTSVQNHIIGCEDGEKLSGTCVTPANMDEMVGKGREFCVCSDRGSIRCVRQHVKEAREELVKMLGFEKFRDLGFCDMGEEVAPRWSDDDAILFHEIVYSNPVTLGRNFWQHLEAAFCFRTMKEIVSYYFNVFVLRRRATQNRNFILDIDSDDDEWHGGYGGPLGAQYAEEDEEEEDSAIESPLHQGTDRFSEKVHPIHQEEGEEDESVSDSDDDDNVDTREGGTGLCDGHEMISYMDRFSGSNEGRLNVEDDSCTTFELAHDAMTNCEKKNETGLGEHQKKSNECNDPMYPKASTNGKDLQPTGSIMEEIFGHGPWDNKARYN